MPNDYGYLRVAVHSPAVKVADVPYNTAQIIMDLQRAKKKSADISLFPELSLTAYTCQDLFYHSTLLQATQVGLKEIIVESKKLKYTCIVGLPVKHRGYLYNCAAMISRGALLGLVPKSFIPNTEDYYEQRWFQSANSLQVEDFQYADYSTKFGSKILFSLCNPSSLYSIVLGIEICEDLWSPISPSFYHSQAGANIICNLSASTEVLEKSQYRRYLLQNHSKKILSAYLYSAAGPGESSSDVVFAGRSLIAETGKLLAEAKGYQFCGEMIIADLDFEKIEALRLKRVKPSAQLDDLPNKYQIIPFSIDHQSKRQHFTRKLYRSVAKNPFISHDQRKLIEICETSLSIQSTGLARRILQLENCKTIIGLSGGSDSTLALLVLMKAYQKINTDGFLDKILAVNLPGPGSSLPPQKNVKAICQKLGIELTVIDISSAVEQQLTDISYPKDRFDRTYENVQARQRMQILMNLANYHSGIVVGTSDLSEIALGWCTYNGDQMAMYQVNAGIPKTLVFALLRYCADQKIFSKIKAELESVISTPISPELLPIKEKSVQKTEEIIGPFDLHDFFLYYHLHYGYSLHKIELLAKIAFKNQYSEQQIHQYLGGFFERFFANQFKRSAFPDGIKVTPVALSPRSDWRMASDVSPRIWCDHFTDS